MMAYSSGGVNEEILDIYENNFEEINSIINEIIHLIITERRMIVTRDSTGTNNAFNASSFGEVVMSEMEKQSQQYSPLLKSFPLALMQEISAT